MAAVTQQSEGASPDANRLRDSFVSLTESLLESIREVFPECEETATARRLFGALVKGDSAAEDRFLRKCMAEIRTRQDRIKEHEVEALFEIADSMSVLKTINMREKWGDPDFSEESKDHLWQYIEALQTYGGLYCAVPSTVMAKIEQVALGVSEKMSGGSFDLSKLDLTSLGKDLITGLSAEEVAEFEGSLTDVYACVGNVASLLAKQSGNDSFDVAAMMNCVQNMQSNVVEGAAASPDDIGILMQQLGGVLGGGAPNPMLSQALASFAQSAASGGDASSALLSSTAATLAVEDGPPAGGPSSKRRKKKGSNNHNS